MTDKAIKFLLVIETANVTHLTDRERHGQLAPEERAIVYIHTNV